VEDLAGLVAAPEIQVSYLAMKRNASQALRYQGIMIKSATWLMNEMYGAHT